MYGELAESFRPIILVACRIRPSAQTFFRFLSPTVRSPPPRVAQVMKRSLVLCCLLAVAAVATWPPAARAAYCGLASYRNDKADMVPVSFAVARKSCQVHEASHEPGCAAEPSCGCPRTRRVKEIVYEKKEYTCYKTVCERVVEQREIDCVRYETEKSFKEVEYTVCKPVWETRTKTVNYTVCKPVWETIVKEIPYTVMKPVYETKTREIRSTVMKPVWETCTKEIPYTVCKQVYEERQETYTVSKPVYETCTKEIPYTIYTPVYAMRSQEI